jgi:PadR family transcriptional regulator AphA
MALRYAILGALTSAPSSGYDLARLFDTGLSSFWFASHSQIYPELRRLEEAGLIESTPSTVGAKLEKRVYSVTPAGLDDLKAWAGGAPQYRPVRDPERLQLIFSDLLDAADVRRHLEAHVDHFSAIRAELLGGRQSIREGRHARIRERLKGRNKARQAFTLLLRDFAYSGDIERAELEIRWAKRSLKALDEYERTRNGRRQVGSGHAVPGLPTAGY